MDWCNCTLTGRNWPCGLVCVAPQQGRVVAPSVQPGPEMMHLTATP